MLRLSKKTDYGLIALKHLAMKDSQGSASAREMAKEYQIPLALLAKILQKLAKEGFLDSSQGSNGGYRLARDPSTISALEVVHSIDGPTILTPCFKSGEACDQSDTCSVRQPLRKIHVGILQLLEGITISDIVDGDEEKKPVSVPDRQEKEGVFHSVSSVSLVGTVRGDRS